MQRPRAAARLRALDPPAPDLQPGGARADRPRSVLPPVPSRHRPTAPPTDSSFRHRPAAKPSPASPPMRRRATAYLTASAAARSPAASARSTSSFVFLPSPPVLTLLPGTFTPPTATSPSSPLPDVQLTTDTHIVCVCGQLRGRASIGSLGRGGGGADFRGFRRPFARDRAGVSGAASAAHRRRGVGAGRRGPRPGSG